PKAPCPTRSTSVNAPHDPSLPLAEGSSRDIETVESSIAGAARAFPVQEVPISIEDREDAHRQILGVQFRELHSGEADDAAVVDIPLLIVQEFTACFGRGFEEGIKRARPAPLQVVLLFLNQVPVAVCIQ